MNLADNTQGDFSAQMSKTQETTIRNDGINRQIFPIDNRISFKRKTYNNNNGKFRRTKIYTKLQSSQNQSNNDYIIITQSQQPKDNHYRKEHTTDSFPCMPSQLYNTGAAVQDDKNGLVDAGCATEEDSWVS
jgi:hypothetical protein